MRPNPQLAYLVARREYLENIHTRGFWLSILILPFVLVLVSFAPMLLRDAESTATYAVIDYSGWAQDAIAHRIARNDLELLLATEGRAPDVVAEARALTDEARRVLLDDTAKLVVALERERGTLVETATLAERLAQWWNENPDDALRLARGISTERYRRLDVPAADAATLNAHVRDGTLLGYFVIPDDPVASAAGAQYVTRNLTNLDLQRWYGALVTEVVRNQRIREKNLSDAAAAWIQEPVTFVAVQLSETGAGTRAGIEDTLAQWAPVGFVYLLWISIFSVTQMLLTSTVEEKSNKLVEVLLSSVQAVDLMAGKIAGIAATGLTIVGAWLLMVIAAALWLPVLLGAPSTLDLSGLVQNPVYLGSFVVYFVLGYLFYAALLSGLGSFANNLKEAQNLLIPVQLFMFAPLVFMIPIGRDPGGWLAETLSWVPPLTPFVMMNRAAMPPSTLTYVFTTVLMVASIYVALQAAARVFETGVLTTGKPPRFRQLVKLLQRRPAT